VERRAGAQPTSPHSYDRAAATFGGARTASLVGRNGAPFPQQLFVDLRRAGWPVSPVLEGSHPDRRQGLPAIGYRARHTTCRSRNAPAIGRAGLQSFVTPPGETLVAPETLAELGLPQGASPQASGNIQLPPLRVARNWFRCDGGRYRDRPAASKMPDQVSGS